MSRQHPGTAATTDRPAAPYHPRAPTPRPQGARHGGIGRQGGTGDQSLAGIGRAIARWLAADGALVAVHYGSNQADSGRAFPVRAELGANGDGDKPNEPQDVWQEAVAAAADAFGYRPARSARTRRIRRRTRPDRTSSTHRGADRGPAVHPPAPSAPTFPVAFQINGIAFDGISTLYTTNLSTGELLGVRIRLDGSAAPASVIDLDRDLVVPDGIRMLDPAQLLVTELVGRLTLVNVHTGATTVVSESLDQPTSVVRVGGSLWVSEGQTLRLVLGQPPNLPSRFSTTK
jgi:hypothetical protein